MISKSQKHTNKIKNTLNAAKNNAMDDYLNNILTVRNLKNAYVYSATLQETQT